MDLLLPLIPHVRFYQEIWIYLTPLIFMLADIITGFSGAYITKNIVSHKMRSGIIKKCGEMVINHYYFIIIYSNTKTTYRTNLYS